MVEFVNHLLQAAAQKLPSFTELEWKDIYEQYVKICKRLFTSLSDGKIVQVTGHLVVVTVDPSDCTFGV